MGSSGVEVQMFSLSRPHPVNAAQFPWSSSCVHNLAPMSSQRQLASECVMAFGHFPSSSLDAAQTSQLAFLCQFGLGESEQHRALCSTRLCTGNSITVSHAFFFPHATKCFSNWTTLQGLSVGADEGWDVKVKNPPPSEASLVGCEVGTKSAAVEDQASRLSRHPFAVQPSSSSSLLQSLAPREAQRCWASPRDLSR